jgi:hypothetical protein
MGNCRFRKNVANYDRWPGYRGGQIIEVANFTVFTVLVSIKDILFNGQTKKNWEKYCFLT